MLWYVWSFIPGLHWIAWLQAGLLTKQASYHIIALIYAIPTLMLVLFRRPPWRLVLISWGIALIHTLVQKQTITQEIAAAATPAALDDPLMQMLLEAALKHDGCLTVTEGVSETGASFAHVERVLDTMVASGYVYTRNNPDTGGVEYVFRELQ
jgi:hypothetical protein